MKLLLTSHTDAQGPLDTEAVAAGLLQYHNTPDPDSGLSPAQIIFGKPMRDLMPVMPEAPVFTNSAVHPLWHETWVKQEDAIRLCFARQAESRHHASKAQPPLIPGDRVLVQNQAGVKPNRWDRTGTIVEVKPHDQHVVRVDGSGRLTLRNKQFLRKVVPIFGPALPPDVPTSSSPVTRTAPTSSPAPSGPPIPMAPVSPPLLPPYTSPCHTPATHMDALQTSTSTGPPRLADAPAPMGAEHRASSSQADLCPSVRPSSEAPVLEDPTVFEGSPSPPAPPPASSPSPAP